MKKAVAVVLALILCFSFGACGKKEEQSGNDSSSGSATKRELKDGENLITGYKTGDVQLGQYTGLTYKPSSTEVTEEEIQAKLDQFANSYKTKVEITGRDTVQSGDIVDIDYEGIMDGVAFEGGTGNYPDLKIGSGSIIPGFEDALIGKSKGSFSIDLTFPEDYRNTDLAGKPVVFNITLKAIYEYEIPELTDALIKEKTNDKYETVAAYRESIIDGLKKEKEEDAEIQKEYDLIKKLIENTTYNIDMEAEIQRGISSLKDYNDAALSIYGMDSVGYYQTYLGLSEEQYMEMLRSQAELSVRYEFARSAIAEAERFQVTDDEIEELGTSLMKQYSYASLDDFYAKLEELNGVDAKIYLAEQVKLNKAGELVMDTAIPEAE